MSNYLGECATLEELGMKRNNLIADINREYAEKRKTLTSTVPPFKSIPILEVPILLESLPLHNQLPYVEDGSVAANMIRIESGKPIVM